MSIIKWAPFFSEFDDMEDTINSMLPAVHGKKLGFTPAIDMYEDEDSIIVETQLGGINSDNVEISIDNNILCLRGESEKKSEIDDKNYYRKEIKRGSFYRSISLPAKIDGDNARAVNEDGILKITIPKVKETQARTIKIENK